MMAAMRHSDTVAVTQYGISFLGSNVHLWVENGPSVTERKLFESIHFPMNLHGISNECNLNKILVHPVNMGLAPIHNKYFERNLTLHHFLLSPVNKPYSDVITKTITK